MNLQIGQTIFAARQTLTQTLIKGLMENTAVAYSNQEELLNDPDFPAIDILKLTVAKEIITGEVYEYHTDDGTPYALITTDGFSVFYRIRTGNDADTLTLEQLDTLGASEVFYRPIDSYLPELERHSTALKEFPHDSFSNISLTRDSISEIFQGFIADVIEAIEDAHPSYFVIVDIDAVEGEELLVWRTFTKEEYLALTPTDLEKVFAPEQSVLVLRSEEDRVKYRDPDENYDVLHTGMTFNNIPVMEIGSEEGTTHVSAKGIFMVAHHYLSQQLQNSSEVFYRIGDKEKAIADFGVLVASEDWLDLPKDGLTREAFCEEVQHHPEELVDYYQGAAAVAGNVTLH